MLQWWLNVGFKTRLISILILVISILMSTCAFRISFFIKSELEKTDYQFSIDFIVIIMNNIISLIEKNNFKELYEFIETIFFATSSIEYIRLFNIDGDLILSFPNIDFFSNDVINISQQILNIQNYTFCKVQNINYSIDLKNSTIQAFYTLSKNNNIIGFLQLGFFSSSSIFYISNILQNFTIFSFASIWLMFILGISFNVLIITKPISKLLLGLRNIASGNFKYKIKYDFKGKIGDLILGFNKMSESLHYYEKKNIAKLIAEKSKLEVLVSTIEDGAILLDTELRVLFVNKVAINIFQWFNKDLIGQLIFQYFPIHVNEVLLPMLNSMIQCNCLYDQMIQSQEFIIDLNYESLKTFRFLLSTVFNYNDCVLTSVIITIQDITRETQLNKAKNQFISNVSHELRTPLCNIGSFLETLIDYSHKLSFQQRSQFLQIAYSETQRLNTLVNDVLDLSKLESEYTYTFKKVILINTISYIVEASQIIALNKQVEIVLEIHRSIKKLLAHEISLYQVLSNLISNSLKFTHKGGRIIIRVYPLFKSYKWSELSYINPEIARLEVIDEGVGIDETFQAQIFDRFMRIENNIHTLKGTGLGLSIVKNIIEKHNSLIYLHSEVGIGTSFWFDLFISY